MAIDGADIGKAQLLKQRGPRRHARDDLARASCAFTQRARKGCFKALGHIAQQIKGLVTRQPVQVAVQRTNRGRNAHVVVVQNDKHPLAKVACGVHRLISHARCNGPVTDHGNGVARGLAHVAAKGKAQSGRDAGRGMRRPKGVIDAFGPLGKTRNPALLPQTVHPVAPTCQDFVGIALVAHIPDQLVHGRIEHGMDRHRQFHHAQR